MRHLLLAIGIVCSFFALSLGFSHEPSQAQEGGDDAKAPMEEESKKEKAERVRILRTIEERIHYDLKDDDPWWTSDSLNHSDYKIWFAVKAKKGKGKIIAAALGEDFLVHTNTSKSNLRLDEGQSYSMWRRGGRIVLPPALEGQKLAWQRPRSRDYVFKQLCDEDEFLFELECSLPSRDAEKLLLNGSIHLLYGKEQSTKTITGISSKKVGDTIFEDKEAKLSITISSIAKKEFSFETKGNPNQVIGYEVRDVNEKEGLALPGVPVDGVTKTDVAILEDFPESLKVTYVKSASFETRKLKAFEHHIFSAMLWGKEGVAKYDPGKNKVLKARARKFNENHEWVYGQDARTFWANVMPNRIHIDWSVSIPKSKGLPIFYAYSPDFVVTHDGKYNNFKPYPGYEDDQDPAEPEWSWKRTQDRQYNPRQEGELHFSAYCYVTPRTATKVDAYGTMRVMFLSDLKTKSLGKMSDWKQGQELWKFKDEKTRIVFEKEHGQDSLLLYGNAKVISKLTMTDNKGKSHELSWSGSSSGLQTYKLGRYALRGLDSNTCGLTIEFGEKITSTKYYIDMRDYKLR